MRDPSYWSIPLGRLFGISIRVHLLFPLVVLGLILRVAYQVKDPFPQGAWIDVTVFCGLLFGSVLLHEFGHCFGARAVNGDASEILLWPLGGLASVDVPHTPGANFLTTLAGPLVNLGLCILCAFLLAFTVDPAFQPPWNPFWAFVRSDAFGNVHLHTWAGASLETAAVWPVLLARLFCANWLLFLVNVLLPGFPLDGGRMLQSALWRYLGYRQSMVVAIIAGFVCVFVVALAAIVYNELLPLLLAGFIFIACKMQWVMLETGGEDSLFGYDFSQGYTSLERDERVQAGPPRRRTSWWKRWLQKRAAQKLQREQETREAEERRMDELLDKVHREGQAALTDEERRFMKRVSDRYRNRN
jgi:Zn-dependent protease